MKNVCEFLRTLIMRSDYLLRSLNPEESSNTLDRAYTGWVESAIQSLAYAELTSYQQKIKEIDGEPVNIEYRISRITGLLESAAECLEQGFVGKLKHILHAEMFGSLATEARGLLKVGHRIPAAVLGRIAIENWLRDEAESHSIPNYDTEKASRLNDSLKSAGKLTQPKWRLVQSLLDVGNAAAHGKEQEFNDDDVKRLLDFVEANCLG
ncbi:hypothetical protein VT84_12165 [Gemmata sp. SH-PL17]|uniref:DUF4145 domain-containing protein n=1 Tax=Gemmata sp. SH-PL17 TaxID=1630693 RepID=UPI00078B9A3E|nr:DUF4145 domain-containing protein [Gemmata sp. SH-PL17]AMV25144.1 hypothetical protein VT84_12165 [Gemmata sp. SH-PL17]